MSSVLYMLSRRYVKIDYIILNVWVKCIKFIIHLYGSKPLARVVSLHGALFHQIKVHTGLLIGQGGIGNGTCQKICCFCLWHHNSDQSWVCGIYQIRPCRMKGEEKQKENNFASTEKMNYSLCLTWQEMDSLDHWRISSLACISWMFQTTERQIAITLPSISAEPDI